MKQKKHHGKLYYTIQILSVLPILFYGLFVLYIGSVTFSKNMHKEIQQELSHIASLSQDIIDSKYPGDYSLEKFEDGAIQIHKGEVDITQDYALLDSIKERTGMEVTLFYRDTRILTTITDWSGKRIVGSAAPEVVMDEVFAKGEDHFYDKTIINGNPYFSYYTPLKNSDGSVVGILFVGKPSSDIEDTTRNAVYPLFMSSFIAMIVAGFVSLFFVNGYVSTMDKIKDFFAKVADGSLHEKLDSSILKRKDEFSEMASSAKSMQHAMRKLIEHDPLTDLYNRRSAQYYFEQIQTKAKENNSSFCVILGDIDFFKKVNDTYGHEAGDIVLKNVAYQLRKLTKDKGIAIRWGGEEFLLILEDHDLEKARVLMEDFLTTIRSLANIAEDNEIYITMTFGITCDSTKNLGQLAALSDEKLYYGKEHGRNQIVTEIP